MVRGETKKDDFYSCILNSMKRRRCESHLGPDLIIAEKRNNQGLDNGFDCGDREEWWGL